MATHASIPAWKIPRTKDPGGIQSTGSEREMTEGTAHTHTHTHTHTHEEGDRSSFAFYLIETRQSSVSQETSHQEHNSWHVNLEFPSLLTPSGPAVLWLFNLHAHPKSVFQLHSPVVFPDSHLCFSGSSLALSAGSHGTRVEVTQREHVASGCLALTSAVTGLSPGPSYSSQADAGGSPSRYTSEIADPWSPHEHTKRQRKTSASPEGTPAKPSVTGEES